MSSDSVDSDRKQRSASGPRFIVDEEDLPQQSNRQELTATTFAGRTERRGEHIVIVASEGE